MSYASGLSRGAEQQDDWGGRFQASVGILREFIATPMDTNYDTRQFWNERNKRNQINRYAQMQFQMLRVIRTDQDFYFPDDDDFELVIRMGEVVNGALEDPRNDGGWGCLLNSMKKTYGLPVSASPRDIAERYNQSKFAENLHFVAEEREGFGDNAQGWVAWHCVAIIPYDVELESVESQFDRINGRGEHAELQESSGGQQRRQTTEPTGEFNLADYDYTEMLSQIPEDGMDWLEFRDILFRAHPNDQNFRKASFMWNNGVKDYLVKNRLLRIDGDSQSESRVFWLARPEPEPEPEPGEITREPIDA